MRRTITVLVTALCVAAGLLVTAGPAAAQGIISALSVTPSVLRDGQSAEGSVSLLPDASESTTVLLFSSDTTVATVPASVLAAPGQSTVTFTVSTNANAPADSFAQITAAVGGVIRQANISVNAAPPAGASLASVSTNPATVTGGSPTTGTVTFSGVPDGASVDLASSNPSVLQVPSQVVVPGGSASGAFGVTTSPVATATTATITASWFGITRSTTVTVTPGAPAPADRVTVTKARWKARLLTIQATGSDSRAILSVFGPSGGFMFTLTNQGNGRYSDQRGWLFNPGTITVRSNLGGSATATVVNG